MNRPVLWLPTPAALGTTLAHALPASTVIATHYSVMLCLNGFWALRHSPGSIALSCAIYCYCWLLALGKYLEYAMQMDNALL